MVSLYTSQSSSVSAFMAAKCFDPNCPIVWFLNDQLQAILLTVEVV